MSASVRSVLNPHRFKRVRESFYRRTVSELPKPYQKFFHEWIDNEDKETPVHWIARKEKWERIPETGEAKMIQNEPIPVTYPNEMHKGLWGGEAVVEGLVKKGKFRSPVPRFWVPELKKTVVYSEVLDLYLSVIVTERALKLIDEHSGLDSYLLKTPAYDLKSLLALKLKRKILLTLIDKSFSFQDENKESDLLRKYQEYLIPRDEAEWYGYSVEEAKAKYAAIVKETTKPLPLKYQFRKGLLQEIQEGMQGSADAESNENEKKSSWVTKLNPFSKPAGTP